MSKKASAAIQPDIEAFLAKNVRDKISLPNAALDDMRYFAKRAKEGSVISIAGLAQWLQEKHGVRAGRTKLFNTMMKLGEKPWWSR